MILALACAVPAYAEDDAVDRAVDHILNRELVLEQPQGIYQPTDQDSRALLDKHGVDIQALQREASQRRRETEESLGFKTKQKQASNNNSRLLIFVSTTMPEASIDRILTDAQRAGAVVMINGMVGNSMRNTKNTILNLNKGRRVGWQIDPPTFRKFGVTVVPTVVLAMNPVRRTACEEKNDNKCIDEKFYGVEGDVPLDYALQKIVQKSPDSEQEARVYLKRLREGPRRSDEKK